MASVVYVTDTRRDADLLKQMVDAPVVISRQPVQLVTGPVASPLSSGRDRNRVRLSVRRAIMGL